MSSSLPSFIYPPENGTGHSCEYNYNDIVNVSWSWHGPPGASVFVILWLSNTSDGTQWERFNQTVPDPGSGSYLSPLNFNDLQYPAYGHFNLWARFRNGSVVGGPNGVETIVAKDETAGSQCQNCTKQASSSIASASSTGTTTSNSATTPIATSGSLIQSPQPTPSGGGLSGGPIAGIVVGVIAAAAIAGVLGVFCQRRRTTRSRSHRTAPTDGAQGSPQMVYRPEQKIEHDGTELRELHDSARPMEKDSTDQPLMASAELGTYR